MIKSYLQAASRFLFKRRGFTAINILGLSIGITACLLISWYVRYHNAYDSQIPDSGRVYRVLYQRWSEAGDRVRFASASPTIGPALKQNFPEIQEFGRAYKIEGVFFNKEIFFEETGAFYGESSTLKILGFDFLNGNPDSCLDAPRKVAISESIAKKYFGDENPIGKSLSFNKTTELEVTAVFKDRSQNLHFKPNIIVSLATWIEVNPKLFTEGWFNSGFYTYAKLKEGVNPKEVNKKIAAFIDKELGETLKQYKMGMGFELQPVLDIHLTSHFMHEIEPNGDKSSINLLEIVAWFILIIAWVNFFNLTTISSIKRIKEIGVRKVNGATRRNLIMQFLMESALINGVAIVFALLFFELSKPIFANLAGLPSVNLFLEKWFLYTILLAFVIGTLSAGIYSVTGIASSTLVNVLKGATMGISRKSTLKKFLVTFQFTIAIALIAGTMGIYMQYQFIKQRDLGFNKDNMLVIKAPVVGDTSLIRKFWVFEQEVKNSTTIDGITFSSIIPGKPNMFNRSGIYRVGDDPNSSKSYRITEADNHFFDVFGLRIIAGSGFTGIPVNDKKLVVLNQNAVFLMGFKTVEDAVGKEIAMDNLTFRITGVVVDFFQQSPKEVIEPQIFKYPRRFQGYFTINYGGNKEGLIIPSIEQRYKTLFPNNPFEYFYLNQFYDKQFQYEKRFGAVFGLFSVLSLLITVLGLLGLSAYTAEMRRKEIGIRKVLGASVTSILQMLYKEYLILLVIASVISLPVVGYFLNKWLTSFALKMSISIWIFIVPVLVVAILSVVTIGIQSIKTAAQNPAKTIKYE